MYYYYCTVCARPAKNDVFGPGWEFAKRRLRVLHIIIIIVTYTIPSTSIAALLYIYTVWTNARTRGRLLRHNVILSNYLMYLRFRVDGFMFSWSLSVFSRKFLESLLEADTASGICACWSHCLFLLPGCARLKQYNNRGWFDTRFSGYKWFMRVGQAPPPASVVGGGATTRQDLFAVS